MLIVFKENVFALYMHIHAGKLEKATENEISEKLAIKQSFQLEENLLLGTIFLVKSIY